MVTVTKNPLKEIDIDSDIDSDISAMSFQRLSFFEKIGLISSSIFAIGIIVISIFSFFVDFSKLEVTSIVFDIILLTMGLSSLYFIYGVYSKKVITEHLIDTAFQEGIYNRLRPLIDNIAQNHIDADIIIDRISDMDLKLQNILKEKSSATSIEGDIDVDKTYGEKYIELELKKPVTIGTSIQFIIKSIFMVVMTMAIFMFFVNFNIGNLTPFVSLSIYILWWIFITNEYNLWKEMSAWYIVFLPIIIVPVSIMVLGNLLNYNVLMAILYSSVGIYAFAYYIWAVYTTTGILPFTGADKRQTLRDPTLRDTSLFSLQQKGVLELIKDKLGDNMKKIKFRK